MKHLPNFLTCVNLFFGCLAIVFVFDGKLHYAAFSVGIAAIFDFADGFAARLLKAQSPIGKDLDSLADLVSFGVAPAAVMFMFMVNSENFPFLTTIPWLLAMPAFLITIFSALRLAKFNNDNRQEDVFYGLPTPANALFFMSLPIVIKYGAENTAIYDSIKDITNDYYTLLTLAVLSSALMVSNISMISLKFKNFCFRENIARYIFIAGSVLMLLILFVNALPLIIIFYLILSLIYYLII